MKTTNCLFALALTALCFSCKETPKDIGATIGSLYISDATPSPGETLNLTYSTDSNKEDISAFYYYTVGSSAYPVDLAITKTDSLYKASIIIPDSATALAFNFKLKKDFDSNNKNGYIIPLTTTSGDTIAGALASIGAYKLRLAASYGVEVDKKEAFHLIKADLFAHEDLQEKWDGIFPRTFMSEEKAEAEKYITRRIAAYTSKPSLTEQEYRNLNSLYQINGNKEKIDSLQVVMAE